MDLNNIRSLVTLLSFAFFLGLMAWTYWPTRRNDFDSAARLPFEGEASDGSQGARHE